MRSLTSSSLISGAALLAAALFTGSLGCELIAGVDRDKIGGSGGSAGSAGSAGTAGSAGKPECTMAAECPPPTGQCEVASCDAGKCGKTPLPAGMPVGTQTPGDCQVTQCDGAGMSQTVNDDTDVSDDSNPCTVDACAAGVPTHDPEQAGTACGAGLQCDGNGACVGCVMPADCPGADDDCQQRTCDAGVCGMSFTAAGTATSTQAAGDCQENRCDGAGKVVSAALDTDLPVDGKACTDDVCMGGVPSNPATMGGVTCNEGGGSVCNGSGACVQCNVASTCPGMDTECQQRTCNAGVCGVQNTPQGTAVMSQAAGDCKVVQCNGMGATETVALDADLPDDSNPCTNDICTAGVPSHTNAMQGTACGMAGVCNNAGACVGCNSGTDCPGQDTECQTRTCTANVCGFSFAASGTPISMQTTGDCKTVVCDGAGSTTTVAQDSDLPVDGNQCTNDVCTAGVPSNSPTGSGSACSQMGGTLCNGAGACVQCLVAATCAGMDTDCHTRTCTAGVCGVANAPAGTVTSMQTAADCKTNQCDGNGNIVSVNSNDPIIDGNQCTNDICTAGVPSNPPSASGAPCSQMSGVVCNGSGTCVQCVMNGDCAGQGGGACSGNVCQAPTCFDGLKNGSETDVDCGGSCAADCALGKQCAADSDCTSGGCLSNVCSLLNGCDLSTATDYTMMAPPAVTFPNGNLTYAPKCIKVKAGTMVTFNGSFVGHPLLGGVVVGGVEVPAMSGPFVPVTNTGTTATFTMSATGSFPYYCVPHGTLGMNGAVFVVP